MNTMYLLFCARGPGLSKSSTPVVVIVIIVVVVVVVVVIIVVIVVVVVDVGYEVDHGVCCYQHEAYVAKTEVLIGH